MAQIEVKVKLNLPAGVELLGYERSGDGHGFEVGRVKGSGAILFGTRFARLCAPRERGIARLS